MRSSRRFTFALPAFISIAVGAALAAQTGGLTIPVGFEHWYLANSMIVTKDSPDFDAIGGLHHVFINPAGIDRLKRGGSAAYPNGTIFVDDVREVALVDGAYVEGARKAIPVMIKDSRKYASTGGWGFQAWAGGDPSKPLVTDPVKSCFMCHQRQKADDFVFSTYVR